MRSRSIDALWMFSAVCAALTLAASVTIALGAKQSGIDAALAATARLMFLLFWPAYSGGALVALFGAVFQPLKQHAREFGLAFASALLVHLGLVAVLCLIGRARRRDLRLLWHRRGLGLRSRAVLHSPPAPRAGAQKLVASE